MKPIRMNLDYIKLLLVLILISYILFGCSNDINEVECDCRLKIEEVKVDNYQVRLYTSYKDYQNDCAKDGNIIFSSNTITKTVECR